MSGNLSCGWSADYLLKKLCLKKSLPVVQCSAKRSETSRHDRFLYLLALFVSDGTPTTFTWSPHFSFEGVSNGSLSQPGDCCWEVSEDKTHHPGMLTCDWQLLWWYVCLLRGYNWFQKRDSLYPNWRHAPNTTLYILSRFSICNVFTLENDKMKYSQSRLHGMCAVKEHNHLHKEHKGNIFVVH